MFERSYLQSLFHELGCKLRNCKKITSVFSYQQATVLSAALWVEVACEIGRCGEAR